MTEGVSYRTNEGVQQLNADKIRNAFVKELRNLLKIMMNLKMHSMVNLGLRQL